MAVTVLAVRQTGVPNAAHCRRDSRKRCVSRIAGNARIMLWRAEKPCMAVVGKGNVYLKWLEPAPVRRVEWAAAIKKERIVISAISFAALLLLRAISVNPNSPRWSVSVLIALGGALFFGVFM